VFFDEVATGMHMREYDYGSLRALMLQAGFRPVEFPLVVAGYWLATPPYRGCCTASNGLCNGFRLGCGAITWPAS
jgi:hypothetical protein